MKNIFITLLLSCSILFGFSAEKFEGVINFKISYKNLPEEMGMYKAMLPKKTKVTIKNEWSKIEQNMGLIAKTNIIYNSATKKTIMLISALGKKFAVENEDTTSKKGMTGFTITKMDVIKIIAGYKCNKIIISDSTENQIILWVTDNLPTYKNASLPNVDFEGFPMEYSMEQNEMRVRMTASEVTEKKIEDKEFEIPEGYEKRTAEEMGEMMKGMKF
jgi:hypothetical protein